MSWQEVRLPAGADVHEAIRTVRARGASKVLAFFDEPWHPGCWILRAEGVDLIEFGTTVSWSPYDDVDLLGPYGFDLICAASAASPEMTTWLQRKLVHCCLNAWGHSRWGEAGFSLAFAFRSLVMASLGPFFGEERVARVLRVRR